VLVESGFGTFARLRQQLPLDELSAVIISHLHADHLMDLVPLRYGLKYGGLRPDPRLPLYAPPGASDYFSRLGTVLDGTPRFFDETYCLREYVPGERLEFGSITFDLREVQHYIPSHAMAIQAGPKLVFSADAAPCQALVDLAKGADLFLCEAALTSLDQDDPDPAKRGHMLASEAADLARRAGVRRLLLTHYRSDPDPQEYVLAVARGVFDGPTELAIEGKTYSV
jgi:ribonuclease BN (tRNA processing enzyme)